MNKQYITVEYNSVQNNKNNEGQLNIVLHYTIQYLLNVYINNSQVKSLKFIKQLYNIERKLQPWNFITT